eukprot:TRINITY_DN9384_c0_g1_i3.p1 TRINITY_DN9384_c0_g1~~TRINITY_DN9384_c0_g1_i3.p1  ORF type:complete len:624 (+),score=114.70 TRINITY_DN9384_c0_g1_i3:46-1917(+)
MKMHKFSTIFHSSIVFIFACGFFAHPTLGIDPLDGDTSSWPGEIIKIHINSEPKVIQLDPQTVYELSPLELKNSSKFLIFEAHTLKNPVILAPSIVSKVHVNSTSPALYKTLTDLKDSPAILKNPWPTNVSAVVFVREYGAGSPVPGECNTQEGVLVKPYLNITWQGPIVDVEFSQAALPMPSCANIDTLVYQVYQFYLPENDCSMEYFLSGYMQFNTLQDIKSSGDLIAELTHHRTSLKLANYPRTGRILAVIVNYENASSIYGLAHTYGCQFNPDPDTGCQVHDSTFMFLSCALGVFVGLFLTFLGHRFFKCSQFLFGFYLGSFAGFIIVSRYLYMELPYLYTLTAASGLVIGLAVLLLWVFLGIPVLSVLLPTLETGFILASVLMYLPLCGIQAFLTNSTFWLVFVCILFCPTLFFLAFTQKASIISNVSLGAVTLIVCIDHYTDSNLKFTFKNVLNRFIYAEFGEAVKCPPFQRNDLILVTCLLGVMVLGLVCQLIIERKKAPFPPAPFQQWRWARSYARYQDNDENTPLIRDEVLGTTEAPSAPMPPPVVGYISGHPGSGGQPPQPSAPSAAHNVSATGSGGGSSGSRSRRYRTSAQSPGVGSGSVRDIFSPQAASHI